MTRMRFQTTIQRNKKTIYKVLTDLRGYPSWLPASPLYNETQEISDHPIRVGTTYVDRGTRSIMRGRVAELEPESRIAFVQTMERKVSGLPGRLDIQASYTLEAAGEMSTRVTREITLKTQGVFLLLQPVLSGAIRQENERILQRLKWYLEAR